MMIGDFDLPVLLAGYGLVSIVVVLIHTIHGSFFVSASRRQHTLYLRKLKKRGDTMIGGNECKNVLTEEYNLLTDLLFPVLDFCVMKHLDESLPILSKQEQLHAKMHNEAKAERRRLKHGMDRWAWYIMLADFFLLRCGKEIGCATAGYAEATSGIWFYWPMVSKTTEGFMSDEYVFHALEELEHGPLTTEYLRTQVFILTPLLLLPVITIVYFVYFLCPPVMVLLLKPSLLFQSKTFVDIARYYCTFVPTFIATMYACVMYWVLPFSQNEDNHARQYKFFQDVCEKRGIEFDVVDQATYSICGGDVKTIKSPKGH